MQVHLPSAFIEAGRDLKGQFLWQTNRSDLPNDITVSMVWRTEGRGEEDRQVVDSFTLEAQDLQTLQGRWLPFTFTVPHPGPITYNGALLRIIWEIQVKVDWPGLFARDDKLAEPFTVMPRSPA